MLGVGSSTFYKMAVKDDGSPNWVGIGILVTMFLTIFVWRCIVIGKQSEVLVRLRFGKVAIPKHSHRCTIQGFNQFDDALEYGSGMRFRFYAFHSLAAINVADRKSELEKKTITFFDRDYEISPAIIWRVSRDPGCPSKALFNVQDGDPKDKKNTELESVVLNLVDDALVRAYAALEKSFKDPVPLPVLDIHEDLAEVRDVLYFRYGVELRELLYGQNSVSAAQREKEGNLAIAAANEKMAEAQNNMATAIRSHGVPIVSD